MVRRICSILVLTGIFYSFSFGDIVHIKFIDAVDKAVRNGYYAGLYSIKAIDRDGSVQDYYTFCIDPLGDINYNNEWDVDYLNGSEIKGNGILYDNSIYSNTNLADEKYAMISYLANQIFYDGDDIANFTFTASDTSTRGDYSLAFWEISENYSGNLLTNSNSKVNALLGDAYAHRDDAIDIAVFSPTNYTVTSGKRTPHSQEFLAFKTTSVPEPGILSLLGIALLSMTFFRRKK